MTQTLTATDTSIYARHVASKMATDLTRMQRLLGESEPTNDRISAYEREMAVLLAHGCLKEATYGYMHNGKWMYALKYVDIGGQLRGQEDAPGGIRFCHMPGADFASFLRYSERWEEMRDALAEQLPFERTEGFAPDIEGGRWSSARKYLSGDLGVNRFMVLREC